MGHRPKQRQLEVVAFPSGLALDEDALHLGLEKMKIKKNHSTVDALKKIHPGRLTWNIQITHLERKMIFQTSMIMFHVNLQGCKGIWMGFP